MATMFLFTWNKPAYSRGKCDEQARAKEISKNESWRGSF